LTDGVPEATVTPFAPPRRDRKRTGRVLRAACATLGLLDLATLVRHGAAVSAHCLRYFAHWGSWPLPVRFLEAARAVLFPSLLASGTGLLAGRRWALLLSAAQAPARILLAVLGWDGAPASFGFLADAGRALSAGAISQHLLLLAAVLLEIARGVFSVLAWRRLRSPSRAPRSSPPLSLDPQ
jgi:hypothetical protein